MSITAGGHRTEGPSKGASVLRPDELATHSRGGDANTTPLVTTARGATTFLNGITRFGPSAAIPDHVHNCLESVVILRGSAVVVIDGERTALRAFDTTLVPANIPHHFENVSDTDEMWILWTYASPEATRTIVDTGAHGRIDVEHAAGGAAGGSPALATPVHEIAEIEILAGREAEFEAGVRAAVPLFQSAHGARTLRLDRSEEETGRYRLIVGWDSVDDHVVGFRESPAFAEWRRLVGSCFASPPRVEHVRNVITGF